jgi:MFS family permease
MEPPTTDTAGGGDATGSYPSLGAAEKASAGWRKTFAALGGHNYRWFWTSLLLYFMAMQMSQIARAFLAYDITGKATALGIVSVAWGLPMSVFSPLGGVVADRVDKKKLLLVTQTFITFFYLVMALLVHAGVIEIWHLVVISFFQGIVWAFNMPARQAFVPELVAEGESLMNALALNSGAMNATRIIGPSLAGALIALPWFGMTGTFYAVVALDTAVLFALYKIESPGVTRRHIARPFWEEMTVGVRYMLNYWSLVVLMLMAFVVVLVGMSYFVLLPVFASEEVYDVGSFGFGMMNTFVGVGAIIGSLLMARMSSYPHRAGLQLLVGVGFGVGLLLFGIAPVFVVALATLSLVGFMSTSYATLNNTLIFAHTEREFTGRVMSVYVLTWSLQPIAILPLSASADLVGARPVMVVVGLTIASFVAMVAVLYPGYRRIGTPAAIAVERARVAEPMVGE